ncbi:beta-1,3-galactosyltransferase 5-like [Argonauta hians]
MARFWWMIKSLLSVVIVIVLFICLAYSSRYLNKNVFIMYRSNSKDLSPVEILPNSTEYVLTTNFLETFTIRTEPSLPSSLSQWLKRSQPNLSYTYNHTSHKHFVKTLISNEGLCTSTSVDILAYVQSSPENYQRRQAIRESWGNINSYKDIRLKIVFVIAKSSDQKKQKHLIASVANEHIQYNDILLFDFVDSYKNLTLKSISTINWIYQFCPQAKYILKADDDIFINVFILIEKFISQIWKNEKSLICHYTINGTSPIVRSPSSKWFVPLNIFPKKQHFPFSFCSGYAILFTSTLLPEMYKNSLLAPYISIDDVYTFGVLLQTVQNITVLNAHRSFTLNQNAALSEYEGTTPITHVAASAWEKNSMSRFWYATIRRLSDWGKLHSNLNL